MLVIVTNMSFTVFVPEKQVIAPAPVPQEAPVIWPGGKPVLPMSAMLSEIGCPWTRLGKCR